ncbi:hypothetical protein ACVIWV_002322 [Bradyrhizobium diazoefficiens]
MRLSAPIYHLKRKAKRLSREEGIPLHHALDRIATTEGFSAWSMLAAKAAAMTPSNRLFPQFRPGDLVLVGARPGQGKTLMSLELAVEAMKSGHRAAFFSLEYTEKDVLERLRAIGVDPAQFADMFEVDCSDAISADYVVKQMAAAPPRHGRGDRLSATARPATGKPRPDRSGARTEIVRARQGADRRLHLADRPVL